MKERELQKWNLLERHDGCGAKRDGLYSFIGWAACEFQKLVRRARDKSDDTMRLKFL